MEYGIAFLRCGATEVKALSPCVKVRLQQDVGVCVCVEQVCGPVRAALLGREARCHGCTDESR